MILAAVDDLMADLAERHGHGELIDGAGSSDVGYYLVEVLGLRAMLTRTPADMIVLTLAPT